VANPLKITKSIRLFFILLSTLLLVGIGLTGFSTVHWLLYLPAGVLMLGGIIGICPGLFLTKLVTKD